MGPQFRDEAWQQVDGAGAKPRFGCELAGGGGEPVQMDRGGAW